MEKYIVDKEQGLASAADEARRDIFLRKIAELVRKKNGTNESEKKGEKK